MSERGFTLVETLVALFIFGMVASAGAFALGNSVEAAQQIEEATDEVAALQRTRAALAADFAQVANRLSRDESGERRPPFASGQLAGGALFAFVRRGPDNPDGEARPALSYVAWYMTDAGLERRSARYLDGAPTEVAALMLPGAADADVSFSYEGAWSEDVILAGGASLPEAVRLRLTHPRFGAVEQLFLLGAGEGERL